ncbi:peptidoglycan DD-metalloendopeptidase family protein [Buchnera aphidicola]|uniref:Lipoprotein NlpD n=1 Tax=Buchnera aphidicola str. Ua (Uroleucon ambrosiae) TaxID=1005057 RepID=G2LPR1_BUCUM|nr:peptidoglycan DD-metalloendopeptidase family protein [Buchnera aphidicola]AEO08198.1 lipoprotein NlpD precursor [Buchnera aphidicola str. Ua (Uroleucon ambrosiae)]
MQVKLFFCFFLLFFYHIFAFGLSIHQRNYSDFDFKKKNTKKFIFYKKNEIFHFLRLDKNFFSIKDNILIKNKNFIGILNQNIFKIFYIVKSKDTLYSIAKKSNHNYHELSKFNLIKKPNKIIIGQKIWIGDFKINKNNCYIFNTKKYISCKTIFKDASHILNLFKSNIQFNKIYLCFSKKLKNNNEFFHKKNLKFSHIWYWPVIKKKMQNVYNSVLSSNKKIEISGVKGQSVFAAAAGEVVCVIDCFKKYGRLIIIKNNKNYFSIYAFNDLILVKKKDKVYAKQKIATMGLSPKKKIARLYFEIRYQGESINPLTVLP